MTELRFWCECALWTAPGRLVGKLLYVLCSRMGRMVTLNRQRLEMVSNFWGLQPGSVTNSKGQGSSVSSFLWNSQFCLFFFWANEEEAKCCVWAEEVLSRVYVRGHGSPGREGGPEKVKPWQPRRTWEGLWISKAMALQGGGQVNLPKSQGQRGPEEGLRISRENGQYW